MSKRILVSDDDTGVGAVIKVMLEDNGYEVMTVSNSKEVLKKAKEFAPSLLLLDIWMPGLGGEKLARRIKKDSNLKHIPIVFVSALGEAEVKKIADTVKAEGFLTKPFDMEDLLKIVRKYT